MSFTREEAIEEAERLNRATGERYCPVNRGPCVRNCLTFISAMIPIQQFYEFGRSDFEVIPPRCSSPFNNIWILLQNR